MKGLRFIVMSLFLPFCATISFAQKETNIWYFGNKAGLDFNSGSPIALTDGQLDTLEGCASISNAQGDLLFYTDGVTVWNRNHKIMFNGSGLKGSFSSTNSAIIVPKPNNPNIYYIFTTAQTAGPDGLRYSEVDLTLDGGLGGVTITKNVLLNSPVTEQVTAIKKPASDSYWVVSHKFYSNEFLAYDVTSLGVNLTPVISALGGAIYDFYGAMKISPDGKKLAISNAELTTTNDTEGNLILCDFDAMTGKVSNMIDLKYAAYGLEFSPNGKVLYASADLYLNEDLVDEVYQFNIESNVESEIINSKLLITKGEVGSRSIGALQLATDGKIYIAVEAGLYLDVINNPNVIGLGCNYESNAIDLNGRTSILGLPPFIQSFFSIVIQTENVCLGEPTHFDFNGSNEFDSLIWDFGDGTTSSDEAPVHTYASAGTYTVTLTATNGSETSIDSYTVTIYEKPMATTPPDMVVCDVDNDGFSVFDLTLQDEAILNGQDPLVFEVFYYGSPFEFDVPISNPTNFINIFPSEGQVIYVRVKNRFNMECEAFTSFFIAPFSNSNESVSKLSLCDDSSVGTDFDGLVQIDLTQKEGEILNGQNSVGVVFNYFTDASYQNEILDPTQYQNTNPIETIYVVATNSVNNLCTVETQFDIEVHSLPIVSSMVDLKQCDDDNDGFSAFNLNEVLEEISSNFMNETISFHESQADAISGINAIENTTTYINQVVSSDVIYARIENNNGCFTTSKVSLVVTTTQIPSAFMLDFYACDVDENGISTFDFSNAQTEIEAFFPLGQDLVIRYYRNQADALAEIGPIEDISDYTNTGSPFLEQIYVRVDSKIDNDCIGLGAHINLYVAPLPEFEVATPQIVCSSNPAFTVLLNPQESNPAESFGYSWMLNGVEIATSPTLLVSDPGTYSVTLTKTDGTGCSRTREVFVNASELATITSEDLTIVQLSDNNSITINTSHLGFGDYEFALDHETSIYQDEPYFDQVRPGKHTIFVRDKNGCGTAQLDVFIMGFPKFFTPNDDGFNDTWNIQGLGNEYTQSSTVYIFDRYGKLLKQLNPRGAGWNGFFNGEKLATSDYWFRAELFNVNGTMTTYRGHFSLVR